MERAKIDGEYIDKARPVEGWVALTSLVQEEAQCINLEVTKQIKDLAGYSAGLGKQWTETLTPEQRQAWGVEKKRVFGGRAGWTFNPKILKEGSEGIASLREYLKTELQAYGTRLEVAEAMPEGWVTATSWVQEEIPRIDPEVAAQISLKSYSKKVGQQWIETLTPEEREAWGVEKKRVSGGQAGWTFNPEIFKEGSEGVASLREYLKTELQAYGTRLEGSEAMPAGWVTVTSWIQEEIPRIDPEVTAQISLKAYSVNIGKRWTKTLTPGQLQTWGVEKKRVPGGQIGWTFNPEIFKEGSEGVASLRAYLTTELQAYGTRLEVAEAMPEGWVTITSWVQEEIQRIDPEVTKQIKSLGGYSARAAQGWMEALTIEQCRKWGVEKKRVRDNAVYALNPELFKEGSEGVASLREYLKTELQAYGTRLEGSEAMPAGWVTVTSWIQEEIPRIDPEVTAQISLKAYSRKVGQQWIETLTPEQRQAWGVDKKAVGGFPSWTFNPEIFKEGSEGATSIREYLKEKLKARKLRSERAEKMEAGWIILTGWIQEEIQRIDPDLVSKIPSLVSYSAQAGKRWAETLTPEQRQAWGVDKKVVVGSQVGWALNPELFKEDSGGLLSLRAYLKERIRSYIVRREGTEVIPDGWMSLSSWVLLEARNINPEAVARIKSLPSYSARLGRGWAEVLSPEQRETWGVERKRVTSSYVGWALNPELFKEGSEGIASLRKHIKQQLEALDIRSEGIEAMPPGWDTLTGRIQDEIKRIDPEMEAEVDLPSYSSSLGKQWVATLSPEQRETWGVERKGVSASKIGWVLNPDAFKEESEGAVSLRDYLKKNLQATRSRFEARSAEEAVQSLKRELGGFLKNIEDASTREAKQFLELIHTLGASSCVDLLFTFHPKFRDVPPEIIHGMLSEYLGETLLVSGNGSVSNLAALEALPPTDETTEAKFKSTLLEAVKSNCYRYYISQKRIGSTDSTHDILNRYLDEKEEELRRGQSSNGIGQESGDKKRALIDHPLISDTFLEALTYFQDIWEVELPGRVATSLKDGREFPDLSQRINIKEIQDKKRMLIADEMGMGKSASAILAHEAAREKARKEGRTLQPALILVPSNVAETWKRYLSADSKRGGCFKEGKAPSVLEIQSPVDFAKVDGVDYVLMTQERLKEQNQAVLETQWSTVIVDEVHKLKATDGVRSSLLRKIAQRQKPEDQLVLLSGTPIPNTIHDIAVTLTLLYPDKFKDTEPGELATQLVRSNLHKIRELLVPRMQAKSLAESVELPPLEEKTTNLQLSPESTLQYRTFVEENDEMDQLSKLHFLRRWLLDPSLVDQEPDQAERIKGEKAQALERRLNEAFEEGDTHIVVFVNDVVDGILRTPSKSPGGTALIDRLSLPKDVKRGVIHGDTSRGERKDLQDTFQSREGRIVLFVSGNTADVGVDFSAGQRVISFNEPWTRYAHEQQRSRVYRPGVQNPVASEILVTLNTIEQGIHEYVERKYHAIEKVLQGIPLDQLEKELLEKDAATDGADASFASEIAEQYLSAWDRLMRLFSASGEVGEEDFQRFVERHGKEYAELYKEFRARSFAGNVNRVCGTVIKSFARTLDRGQVPQVLDVASGPEMLRRALPEDLAKGVTSMDTNPHMFEGKTEGPTIVAGWTQVPVPDQSFDVVSSSLAWVHSSMQPRKGEVDRVKVLEEMQRVLKVGGWAVIALTPARPLKDIGQFKAAVSELGFDILEEYTGSVRTHDNAFQLPLLTLKKRESVEPKEDLVAWTKEVLERYPDAFAFEKSKSRGRHPRKMFGSCVIEATLNGTPTPLPMELAFKDEDRKIYEEEKGLLQMARSLKSVFAEMRAIPPHVLKQHNLSRVRLDGGSYALYTPFKTTESGLLIGETVWKGL